MTPLDAIICALICATCLALAFVARQGQDAALRAKASERKAGAEDDHAKRLTALEEAFKRLEGEVNNLATHQALGRKR